MSQSEADIRWGRGTRADTSSAKEQLLDAARVCYETYGVSKTTVEHVAREAKVSRTTVYRYFKNRDEILTGVVVRDTVGICDMLEEELQQYENFSDFLIEGIMLCLKEVPQTPIYNLLCGEDGEALMNRLCISSEEFVAMGIELVMPAFNRALERDEIREDLNLLMMVEWVCRLFMSFLTAPSHLSNEDVMLREAFRTMLLPAILKPVA